MINGVPAGNWSATEKILVTSNDSSIDISGKMPGIERAQRAITFHIEFKPEIVKNARYEKWKLYSIENLKPANEASSQA